MAEPSDAIPPELREAFHTAVAEYHSWRPGEDEPGIRTIRTETAAGTCSNSLTTAMVSTAG